MSQPLIFMTLDSLRWWLPVWGRGPSGLGEPTWAEAVLQQASRFGFLDVSAGNVLGQPGLALWVCFRVRPLATQLWGCGCGGGLYAAGWEGLPRTALVSWCAGLRGRPPPWLGSLVGTGRHLGLGVLCVQVPLWAGLWGVLCSSHTLWVGSLVAGKGEGAGGGVGAEACAQQWAGLELLALW